MSSSVIPRQFLPDDNGNRIPNPNRSRDFYKTGFLMALSAIAALISGQLIVTKNIMTRQDMDIMEAHQAEVHKTLQDQMTANSANIAATTGMVEDLRGQINIMKSDIYRMPVQPLR